MDAKHTPGPWVREPYSETLGYDCMTGGIKVGPVYLDGADYGQQRSLDIEPAQLARMAADARLISAAPDMLAILQVVADDPGIVNSVEWHSAVLDALAKATGQPVPAETPDA